jgi:hypothetical protein
MAGGWGVEVEGLDDQQDDLEAMVDAYGEMGSYTVISGVEYAVYVEFGTRYMEANGALRNAVSEVMANLDTVLAGTTDPEQMTKNVAEAIMAGWKRDVWVDTGRLRRSIHLERIG